MTYGTSHFETLLDAVRYYRDYEGPNALKAVEEKLICGSIHIGPPKLKDGQTLHLNHGEGRYFITDAA